MVTLKLKKKPAAPGAAPQGHTPYRAPIRGGLGARGRPTLAQWQADREALDRPDGDRPPRRDEGSGDRPAFGRPDEGRRDHRFDPRRQGPASHGNMDRPGPGPGNGPARHDPRRDDPRPPRQDGAPVWRDDRRPPSRDARDSRDNRDDRNSRPAPRADASGPRGDRPADRRDDFRPPRADGHVPYRGPDRGQDRGQPWGHDRPPGPRQDRPAPRDFGARPDDRGPRPGGGGDAQGWDRRPQPGFDRGDDRGFPRSAPDRGDSRGPDPRWQGDRPHDRGARGGPQGGGDRPPWQQNRPDHRHDDRRPGPASYGRPDRPHEARPDDRRPAPWGDHGRPPSGFRDDRGDPRQAPPRGPRPDQNAGPRPGPRPAPRDAERRPLAPARPVRPGAEGFRQGPRDDGRPQRPQPVPQGAAGEVVGERLSKRMTALGLASRREADEWIEAGWVRVDGRMAVLGQRVTADARIVVDDAAHKQQALRVTILINKPVGYVSGQAEDGYEPAAALIKPENQWEDDKSGLKWHPGHLRSLAPAGRLDIDSVGLLVLTQDGRVAKQLIGDESLVEKEYLVRVAYGDAEHPQHALPESALELLREGLELDGEALKSAKVSWQNEDQLRFVLREGKKRQIRRMCEAVGLQVLGLKRVRIGSVALGHLPAGQWRYLRRDEFFI
jgi:23S rRNA pseudouridine2604 synthase